MIIDMRCRPPFGSFLDDGVMFDPDVLDVCGKTYGTYAPKAALNRDITQFIQEMDDAGIDKAVAPVRITRNGNNSVIAELLKTYPDRIVGMLGINGLDNIQDSLDAIDQYITKGNYTGVNIEPGFTPEAYAKNALTCDDHLYYPIYEKCQKEGITVLLSFGGLCHEGLSNFMPETLDRVLADFPKLRVIIAHGGYPWIPQVFWIAQRRENLWISPDIYIIAGGGSMYIEAARYFLKGKILFGSAYPACNLEQAVKFYKNFNMDKETYDQVMGEAAAVALGLH